MSTDHVISRKDDETLAELKAIRGGIELLVKKQAEATNAATSVKYAIDDLKSAIQHLQRSLEGR